MARRPRVPVAPLLAAFAAFLLILSPDVLLPPAAEAAALTNCRSGCDEGERCVGTAYTQPVTDDACTPCGTGQEWWPCNFETLCYCSAAGRNAPRYPPAPTSRYKVLRDAVACRDVLTEGAFDEIVNPSTEEGRALFTYDGLCEAIATYNANHEEKFAAMGTEEQIRSELASFLAHAYADTGGFGNVREARSCVNPIADDGQVYCKPCPQANYDKRTGICAAKMVTETSDYSEYCDMKRKDPGASCSCSPVPMATIESKPLAEGYVEVSQVYFPRGAIAVSTNSDYLAASYAVSGQSDTLCGNPDLASSDPATAWGVGIWRWMEKMQYGSKGQTAHIQALRGNFGGTVKVLYDKLECPSSNFISKEHTELVKDRLRGACIAGKALGAELSMHGCLDVRGGGECQWCEGLRDLYEGKKPQECEGWSGYIDSPAETAAKTKKTPAIANPTSSGSGSSGSSGLSGPSSDKNDSPNPSFEGDAFGDDPYGLGNWKGHQISSSMRSTTTGMMNSVVVVLISLTLLATTVPDDIW